MSPHRVFVLLYHKPQKPRKKYNIPHFLYNRRSFFDFVPHFVCIIAVTSIISPSQFHHTQTPPQILSFFRFAPKFCFSFCERPVTLLRKLLYVSLLLSLPCVKGGAEPARRRGCRYPAKDNGDGFLSDSGNARCASPALVRRRTVPLSYIQQRSK